MENQEIDYEALFDIDLSEGEAEEAEALEGEDGGGGEEELSAQPEEAAFPGEEAEPGEEPALPEAGGAPEKTREAQELETFAGMIDPYTCRPITSREELLAFRERYEADEERQARNRPEYTWGPDQERDMFIRTRIDGEMQKIMELDPTIKGRESLAARPEFRQMTALVERGYSLSDAYRLLSQDRLAQQRAEAERQAALNSMQGKNHLSRTTARGRGASPVPAEVAEEYRMFLPDISDAEIQEHYENYIRSQKRK